MTTRTDNMKMLPATTGKWSPFYSSRNDGHRLLGHIEVWPATARDGRTIFVSNPNSSRIIHEPQP